MRKLIYTAGLTAGISVALSGAGSLAAAQYPSGSFYTAGPAARERDARSLFDHTRMDLDRAAAYQYASAADRKRFDEARRELFDFESRFDQGRYDTHILNRAVDRIDSVVSHNSLDPRDRGALSEDLRRMRDYREFRAHNPAF